ncbi:MAG: 1-deoxy-D-xylulose-5-phosphate reductoisomerase [Coriobacteriales bacterium]|nr:1-deoxy-D-xylulose-5-phosphate reductoisomerase [Coriobacteriales bacterium]
MTKITLPEFCADKILVLGSTGSIGKQTLEVCKDEEFIEIVGLSCSSNIELLVKQAIEFDVKFLAVCDANLKNHTSLAQLEDDVKVFFGQDAVLQLLQAVDFDVCVNALSGCAGLEPSYECLKLGKKLALANKESLVVAGDILIPLSQKMAGKNTDVFFPNISDFLGNIIPIDSEHSAIYQCLLGYDLDTLKNIWLTASGGPFRGDEYCAADFENITPQQALAHPTWNMGAKISVDSATMMNKGLEVIEACHLFHVSSDKIKVLIHPQSIVHSMVEFVDGAYLAQLGAPSMTTPIAFAIHLATTDYKNAPRFYDNSHALDFYEILQLNFGRPDLEKFECLKIALEVAKTGKCAPAIMNAANEIAVAKFLAGECKFSDIARIVEKSLSYLPIRDYASLEEILDIDKSTREYASKLEISS